jgi:type I restriction enzyme S subunit
MERWAVGSFTQIEWQWPREAIKPLASVLRRRNEVVDRNKHDFATLQLATLHFDGEFEPRDLRGKSHFKGKLFFAHAGDVVYSKIDVRNGAIGIIPDSMPLVAVSSEYPVYEVDAKLELPAYIKLVFRTKAFRDRINGMISGASGRKRVQPEALEEMSVPLPPLAEQRAIVERWRAAQAQIAAAHQRVEELAAKCRNEFLAALGIQSVAKKPHLKCFGLRFAQLDRWSVEYLTRKALGLAEQDTGRYSAKALGQLCDALSGGTPSTKESRFWGGEIPWVSPKDMKSDTVTDTADHVTRAAIEETGIPVVPAQSVLMVMRSGILQRTVPVALLTREASINQDMRAFLVRDTHQLLPEFLAIYLQHRQDALLKLVKWSTTVQSMNAPELERFLIPLPPLAVQRKLVERVAAARAEMARERAAAAALRQTIAAEVEALILGEKP